MNNSWCVKACFIDERYRRSLSEIVHFRVPGSIVYSNKEWKRRPSEFTLLKASISTAMDVFWKKKSKQLIWSVTLGKRRVPN